SPLARETPMTRPAPRPWPKGQPHPTRGTRHAWRGHWGDFTDGRSKLSRLALRIERELLLEYSAVTPLHRRRVTAAARFMALAEQTLLAIGTDRKATRRAVTALQLSADRQLAGLEIKHGRRGLASVVGGRE